MRHWKPVEKVLHLDQDIRMGIPDGICSLSDLPSLEHRRMTPSRSGSPVNADRF
ncbi:MAG: hypothetical protein WCA35_18700 [Kovacikia sp.]